MQRPARLLGPVAVGLALAVGCAPKQQVPLDVVPADAALFVDGNAVAGAGDAIELRSDRDHALYFKSPGYRSELVVLETRRDGRDARLVPDAVKVRLRRRDARGKEVRVEPETSPAAAQD